MQRTAYLVAASLVAGTIAPFLFLSLTRAAAQDSPLQPPRKFFEANIQAGAGGNLEAVFDLGGLSAGQTERASLRLHNKVQRELTIKSMTTTCGCIKAKTRSDVIPVDGFVDCDFQLDVPQQATKPSQNLLITLFYEQKKGISLRLNYEIAGLASFQGSTFITKAPIGTKSHAFRIPVLITPPVKPEDVEVLADDSLGFSEMELVHDDSGYFLACEVDFTDNERGRDGFVTMLTPTMKKPNALTCVIGLEEQIVIAPHVLRFVPNGDSDELVCKAILRVHESILGSIGKPGEPGKPGEQERIPEVTARTDQALTLRPVELKRLARGVYRVEITAVHDANAGQDEAVELKRSKQVVEITVHTVTARVRKEVATIVKKN